MQEIMQFVGNHQILSMAWIILLVLVIVITVKSLFSKIKSISHGEAIQQINRENAIIVDIRSRDDYRKGHIIGALNIMAADIKKGNFGEFGKHKSQPVIVVCATGMTATESASQLSAVGFTKISVLKDGVAGWSSNNLPLVRGNRCSDKAK